MRKQYSTVINLDRATHRLRSRSLFNIVHNKHVRRGPFFVSTRFHSCETEERRRFLPTPGSNPLDKERKSELSRWKQNKNFSPQSHRARWPLIFRLLSPPPPGGLRTQDRGSRMAKRQASPFSPVEVETNYLFERLKEEKNRGPK